MCEVCRGCSYDWCFYDWYTSRHFFWSFVCLSYGAHRADQHPIIPSVEPTPRGDINQLSSVHAYRYDFVRIATHIQDSCILPAKPVTKLRLLVTNLKQTKKLKTPGSNSRNPHRSSTCFLSGALHGQRVSRKPSHFYGC